MKAYCEWPPNLYLAGLQDQPPAASRWPNIIFDMRIEILALKNLHIDIHESILVWPLYLYLAGLQDQPPVASKCLDFIYIFRIKYLSKKIYFKCIFLFWWEFYTNTWSRTASSSLQVNGGWGQIFFKIRVVYKYRSLHKKFHADIS